MGKKIIYSATKMVIKKLFQSFPFSLEGNGLHKNGQIYDFRFFGLICSSSIAEKPSEIFLLWGPSKPYQRVPKDMKIREKYIKIIILSALMKS